MNASQTGARPNALDVGLKLGDIISKFALVAGGIFALVQFLEARHDAKVERTMVYITRFEDGRVSDARRQISGAIRPYISQFAEIEAAGGVGPEQRRELILTLVDEGGDDGLPEEIDTLVDFYEGLWTCVREELCAADVAYGYFSAGEAPEFWADFQPYFESRRANNAAYAQGLEHFAQSRP